MQITCLQCGAIKEKPNCYVKRRKLQFCCKKCFYKYQKKHKLLVNKPRVKKIKVACDFCGKPKEIYKSQQKKHNFCNQECYIKYRLTKNNSL